MPATAAEKATVEAETGTLITGAVVATVMPHAMEMVVVATMMVSAMGTATAMGTTAMGTVIVTVKADQKADILVVVVVEEEAEAEEAAGMVTAGITGTAGTTMKAEAVRTGIARAGKMAAATGTTARQMVLPFLSRQSARRVDGIAKSPVSPLSGKVCLSLQGGLSTANWLLRRITVDSNDPQPRLSWRIYRQLYFNGMSLLCIGQKESAPFHEFLYALPLGKKIRPSEGLQRVIIISKNKTL